MEVKRIRAARDLFGHIAELADAPFTVRLWDGSTIPMGKEVDPELSVSISDPGVLGALLRRPTLENLLKQYVTGGIRIHSPSLITFFEKAKNKRRKARFKELKKSLVIKNALPFLTAKTKPEEVSHR